MERIKVAVSPFFGGEDWTDELTNITFEKNPRGLNVYSIPTYLDLTNIRKAIQLNALILVEGNIEDYNEVEEIVVKQPIAKEVKEEDKEANEKVIQEEPVVEAKETPKKKSTKKKSSK